ncbi:glycerophosphoryl diester phosphodiesterase membrane domain-containing protein [Synechococcus sp. W55.1]|uniref:glycerophosphoryl diester phosphodiesterase membrane domain-containing protein n=1 Tax=Synechococcus sp. W55.1 TaxID=2964512 RepID=UPI0039C3FC7E
MKGVNLVAHEDPSVMQNATLSPIPLLQRSFEMAGPIYGPLLILASPGFIIPIVAELIPLAGGILNLAYLIGAPILAGAAFWLVDQHLKQRTPPLGNSLDRAVSRAVPLVFGSILLVLIVSLGMLLFVLPGIYWGIRLAFTLCAIVLEDKGATEGLGYSWNLVRGRWWGVFWASLAVLAVALIFGIAIAILAILISFFVGGILGATLGAAVVGNAAVTAVAPILDIYTVLLFRSLQQLQAQAAS